MIRDIIETNSNLQLVIGANELKELARIIIDKVRDEFTSEEERKNDNTYLTNEAVCKMLGKSRGTLWRWVREGYLPAVKVGRSVRFRKSSLRS